MFDAPATSRPMKLTTVAALGESAWRAEDPALGPCVLTLEKPSEIQRRRRTLRRMNHSGVRRELRMVAVAGHGPGLLTTYLSGVPLSRFGRERTMRRPREAIRIGEQVLSVLAHAHQHGVVHGPIAMRHVIVGDSLGLVGFGKVGDGVEPRDDIASVGALLFELVTGEPWRAGGPQASDLRPSLGRALDDWLATVRRSRRGFRDADAAKSALFAVGATMPPPSERPYL